MRACEKPWKIDFKSPSVLGGFVAAEMVSWSPPVLMTDGVVEDAGTLVWLPKALAAFLFSDSAYR